jgi:hypothetical protein
MKRRGRRRKLYPNRHGHKRTQFVPPSVVQPDDMRVYVKGVLVRAPRQPLERPIVVDPTIVPPWI